MEVDFFVDLGCVGLAVRVELQYRWHFLGGTPCTWKWGWDGVFCVRGCRRLCRPTSRTSTHSFFLQPRWEWCKVVVKVHQGRSSQVTAVQPWQRAQHSPNQQKSQLPWRRFHKFFFYSRFFVFGFWKKIHRAGESEKRIDKLS